LQLGCSKNLYLTQSV